MSEIVIMKQEVLQFIVYWINSLVTHVQIHHGTTHHSKNMIWLRLDLSFEFDATGCKLKTSFVNGIVSDEIFNIFANVDGKLCLTL
jgi:hypothetical protein